MYNDDEDDFDSIEGLLESYYNLKAGNAIGNYLEQEDYELLFDFFQKKNNNKEAQQVLTLALSYYPTSLELLVIQAEFQYENHNYGQALKTLEKVEEITPIHVGSIILKIDILQEMDKSEEAIQWLQSKIDIVLDWDKIELILCLAEVYDELNDSEAVFNTLVTVLEYDPNHVETLHKLAFWADLADKNEDSVAIHNKIIDLYPFNHLAWYNLGSAYHSLKDYPNAIDAYEYCVAIDDTLEAAYRNLADAYIKNKDYDNAITTLLKNIEIGKPEDIIYEALGLCYEKKKDLEKAREYYRKALELSPKESIFFYKIGETYTKEKKYDKAYESYLTAFNIDEDNYTYAYALGMCLSANDFEKEAIIYYLRSLTIKPNQKNTWIALGKSLYKLGLYEELLIQKDIMDENCGFKAEFEYLKVAALFALGKSKEATLTLHDAMELSPSKFKLLEELQPDILTRKSVIDVWSQYKKKK